MKIWKQGEVYWFRFQVGKLRIKRSTGTGNKAEATEMAMAAWREAKDRKRGIEPIPTLGEAVEKWLASHKVKSATGAGDVSWGHWRNVSEFGRLYTYGMEDMRLDRITNEVVMLARGKHLEGRAATSADLWLRNLNLIGNWAVGAKLLAARPWSVKPINPAKVPKPTIPLAMVKAYLSAAAEVTYKTQRGTAVRYERDPDVGIALRLMFGLGLRESEVLGFRWEWLNLEAGTYTPGNTKGKEAKPVPMASWLRTLLLKLKGDQQRLGLIISDKDGEPHAAGFTRKAMAAANAKLGIKGLSPHRIRGTWVTMLLRRGTPPKEVQKMARHKNLNTTMGYYEDDLEVARRHQEALGEEMGLA